MAKAIQIKSRDFAIRIVGCYKFLVEQKNEYVMSKQLLRCGTSIGANTRESKNAQSRMDFLNKLNIALKEADETEYWLEIAVRADIIPEDSVKSLIHDCGTIRRMLISSINTAKKNIRESYR